MQLTILLSDGTGAWQVDQLEALTPEWLAFLETQPLGASVFNDPLYLTSYIKNDIGKMNRTETLSFCILREDGHIRCVAPIYFRPYNLSIRLATKNFFRIPIRLMAVFGESFVYEDSPKCHEWFRAIFNVILRPSQKIDRYTVELFLESPFADYLLKHFESNHRVRCVPNETMWQNSHQIVFPESFDALIASYSQSTKKNIRKNKNALEKNEPRSQFLCFTHPEDMHHFLENMDEIRKSSWKSTTYGFTPWNVPNRVAFIHYLALLGWVRGYLLLAESGRPIAFRYGLCYRDCFHAIDTCYDTAYHHISPGTNTLYKMLEMLMAEQPCAKYLDFGFGSMPHKVIYGNKTIPSLEVSFHYSIKSRFWCSIQNCIDRFVWLAKKALNRLGIENWVHKYLKNKK